MRSDVIIVVIMLTVKYPSYKHYLNYMPPTPMNRLAPLLLSIQQIIDWPHNPNRVGIIQALFHQSIYIFSLPQLFSQ